MLGTAILLAAINYHSFTNDDDTKAAYAVPIALFAIIMMIGPVSGGHVNPAVSTSVFIWKFNEPNGRARLCYLFQLIFF
jgi:glycerol uptake facilitator-like aquaporin